MRAIPTFAPFTERHAALTPLYTMSFAEGVSALHATYPICICPTIVAVLRLGWARQLFRPVTSALHYRDPSPLLHYRRPLLPGIWFHPQTLVRAILLFASRAERTVAGTDCHTMSYTEGTAALHAKCPFYDYTTIIAVRCGGASPTVKM